MASEVQLIVPSKPPTAYFVVRNAVGQYWYTTTPAWESYNAAHWTAYAIAMSQDGSSQNYAGTFPSAIAVGAYQLSAYAQSGGSPAIGDVLIGTNSRFDWTGSAILAMPASPASTTNITSATGIDVTKINGDSTAAENAGKFWKGAVLDSGTAQAGASTTITLQSGANSNDNYYLNAVVVITSGAGAGQNRRITGYVGSTKVATISGDRNWVTAPDNTSVYTILGNIP